MIFTPHDYQRRAIDWVINHERCLLFLDMGLGKTVSTLSAIQKLMDYAEVEKMLVVAPKKVAEATWSTEAQKWDHLHLRISVVMGTVKTRERRLSEDADIYVTGRDTVTWLVERLGKDWPFDMVVLDELTSFKSHRSNRFKAIRKMLPRSARVVGLTGTPTPNGYKDLWAQVYCIDGGERLGRFVTHYRQKYFNSVVRNNIEIKTWLKPGAEDEIKQLLADITITMQSEDYLTLPPLIEHDVPVALPDKVATDYLKFERDCVMEACAEMKESKGLVTAASAASLSNKLSQYANGAIYTDDHAVREIHDEKLTALEEILEVTDSPVLCFYQYKHDCDRIMARFAKIKPVVYQGPHELDMWNEGKIRLLLAHPASTAFGLNMQHGGHTVVWFSTGWNLELYEQANARLHRQGQQKPVTVHRLIAIGTIDERMAKAISGKRDTQLDFMHGMKRLIKDYGK